MPSVRRYSGNASDEVLKRECKREITAKNIAEYLAKKAHKNSIKLKLVDSSLNRFGDSNLCERFIWRKKIERDVLLGVPLHEFSLKAEKKRQRERMDEIENIRKKRQERIMEKPQQRRQQPQPQTVVCDEDAVDPKVDKVVSDTKCNIAAKDREKEEEADEINLNSEVYLCHDLRKPKYFSRVHTGYQWNKYNRIHYDHDNPPPKFVQGYKFDVFYPDLIDKSKAPTYTIENDGESADTCIIRFHGGPPYQDIAFRIVNGDWEYSQKKGFKCTFEQACRCRKIIACNCRSHQLLFKVC